MIINNLFFSPLKNLSIFFKSKRQTEIYYISDEANWVLDEIANSLRKFIPKFIITNIDNLRNLSNVIIHFSTIYNLNDILNVYNENNRYIITIFHINNDHLDLIKLLSKNQEKINIVHTSCNITKNELIRNGISARKIIIIPIGIDLRDFSGTYFINKKKVREELNIPSNSIVIGSFQKDGNGWNDGDEPKLIKGPDVFCNVCNELNKKFNIFVLLLGPARGYVKNTLEKMGINYISIYEKDYKKIKYYYRALDLYLITSRVEGGPRSLLECLATGVPIVSTKVGQAPEIIIHGENGFLTDIADINQLVEYASIIIENKKIRNSFITEGLKTVKKYDYQIIAKRYLAEIYNTIVN